MVVQCSAPNMCHNNQQSVLTDLVSRLQSAIPNKMVSPQSVSVSSARDIPSQVTFNILKPSGFFTYHKV